jgi:flagellar hook protein FlgE
MSFSGVFAIGVSGLTAFTASLGTVSNNIANSQTAGFKRVRTDFADLIAADAPDAGGKIGTGVGATDRHLVAEQGALKRTDVATDIAISGDGFFVVSKDASATSDILFTRAGDFTPNAAGDLYNAAGYFLRGIPMNADGTAPSIANVNALSVVNINREPPLAGGATPVGELLGVEIDGQGRVVASYATGERIALYQLPLAIFRNVEGLAPGEGPAYFATSESGNVVLTNPKTGRAGQIEGSALEISTVDIGQEFSTLIQTQRAYASNARIISIADELWRTLVETAA